MMSSEQLILYLILIVLGLAANMRPAPVARVTIRIRPAAQPEFPSLPARIAGVLRRKVAEVPAQILHALRSWLTATRARISATSEATVAATAAVARTCEEALLGETIQPALAPCQ